MSQQLRARVLDAFKSLHRTRQRVFDGDQKALNEARNRINEEYKKCKHIIDTGSIEELIAYSKAVENELKATVIQMKLIEPGKYQAKLRDDIVRLDNVPFMDCTNTQPSK